MFAEVFVLLQNMSDVFRLAEDSEEAMGELASFDSLGDFLEKLHTDVASLYEEMQEFGIEDQEESGVQVIALYRDLGLLLRGYIGKGDWDGYREKNWKSLVVGS